MAMQKCPVCEGRGSLPANFYDRSVYGPTKLVQCRTCHGSGMVYSPDPVLHTYTLGGASYTVTDYSKLTRDVARDVADAMAKDIKRHRSAMDT